MQLFTMNNHTCSYIQVNEYTTGHIGHFNYIIAFNAKWLNYLKNATTTKLNKPVGDWFARC